MNVLKTILAVALFLGIILALIYARLWFASP